MKKLFLGSIALTVFSLSILIFQISCQKTAVAQQGTNPYVLPVATPTILGGVKPDGITILVDATGKISASNNQVIQSEVILYRKFIPIGGGNFNYEYWTCAKDGSNKRQIIFPSTLTVRDSHVSLLADKNSVVFPGSIGNGVSEIYTMNIDGSNLKKIVGDGTNEYYAPEAYW